jgi:hypothetical protein
VRRSSLLLRSTIAFAFVTIARSAQSGIDFTASTGERMLEGIKFPELYFHENGRKISYEQPRGWTYSADTAHIKLVPPDVRQALGEFTQAPLPKPQNFDDQTMKFLQEKAIASVPSDSQEVTVVSAEKNPLMINQHETFEVIVAYQLYGERYQQSVLFMNLSDTQLTFRLVARKTDFEKLHRAFRGSLCSLQWL